MLTFTNVTYTYPSGETALSNLNITLPSGKVTAIMGHNGAGKTTFAKLACGLLKPTSGIVTVDGIDTRTVSAAKIASHISLVFQNPDDQIFRGTVIAEAAFGPRPIKRAAYDNDILLGKALELTRLAAFKLDNPYDLSLPMRKFVAIAAAIAGNADTIIMDEPTAGQDLFALERLSAIIAWLKGEGKTVAVITHDEDFAASNADEVIVFER